MVLKFLAQVSDPGLGGWSGDMNSGGQMLRVASGLGKPPLKSLCDKQVKRTVATGFMSLVD